MNGIERRIEVVANGLPSWHGSQLALDATIVSPLTRRGEAHPRADTLPGCAANAARRKRHSTYCTSNSAAPSDAAFSSSAPRLA